MPGGDLSHQQHHNVTQLHKVLKPPGAGEVAVDREKTPISPLGWGIGARLLCALAVSALLWLAVAWAIGWLS